MRKKYLIIGFILSLLFIGRVDANTINKLNVDVYIDSVGDAHIKETWNYTSNKNTEIYHSFKNLGNSTITDLKVSDSTNTNYTYVNNWDVDGSFNDKKYKYGYNYISGGVELCAGISHYGTYNYTFSYTVKNFVYNLTDSQMVYWNFWPVASEKVQNYYIKIYADQKFSDNLDVWGYGAYGDYAYVYNGYIELSSEDALESNEYVTTLIKFPTNYFTTSNNLNHDFNYYLDMASEGSTKYVDNEDKESIFAILLVIGINILIWGGIIVALSSNYRSFGSRVKKKKIDKKAPYFRELPCDKDIALAYFISSEYDLVNRDTDYLGAILLKWIKEKNIILDKNEKKKVMINLVNEPIDETEKELYNYMVKASRDGILEEKEFTNWSKNNYDKLFNWFKKVLDKELEKCVSDNLVTVEKKVLSKKYLATEKFDEVGNRLRGLKSFFKEFASLNEKEPIEVMLWQEYLMYAQIFGIADQVAKDFKKIYPDVLTDNTYDNIIIVRSLAYDTVSAASVARSRAQSYSAGGGGFSSGGGGMGSFGGGGSAGSR